VLSKKLSEVHPQLPIDVLNWDIVRFTIQGVSPNLPIRLRQGITIPHIRLRSNGAVRELLNVSLKGLSTLADVQ
jgi:hypothetical protein